MPYLLLTVAVLSNVTNNVVAKVHNKKTVGKTDSVPFYNLILTAAACLFWLVMFIIDGEFDASVLLYSLMFGLAYFGASTCYILAVKNGPVSLSVLLLNMSLLPVTVCGFIFWNVPVTPISIVGIVLVIASIFLCVYEKNSDKSKTVSLKWIIFAFLAFASNAACSIIMNFQQRAYETYDNKCQSMMMFFALLLVVTANLVLYLTANKENRCSLKEHAPVPICAGLSNSVGNLLIMLLIALLPTYVIYPVYGVGTVIVSSLLAVVVFKEKLPIRKWIGVAVGIVAVFLLNFN